MFPLLIMVARCTTFVCNSSIYATRRQLWIKINM